MAVTIKQISEISGISRGTVDRVLNGRGKVSPEKEALIRSVAEKLGYKPNLAGKALAARKKPLVIGVVLPAEGNPFFNDVIRGIRQAEKELSDYGIQILIKSLKGYDTVLQLAAIDALAPKVNSFILTPIDDPEYIHKINELSDNGKHVVTMNTDVDGSQRLCYVGSDYIKGGQIACGILGLITGGKAKVGILTGSRHVLGHNQRIEGFCDVAKIFYPDIEIISIAETLDDDTVAFQATKKILTEIPETNALFIAAAGSAGVFRAIRSSRIHKNLSIVAFDRTPETEEMMAQGIVKTIISQQPFVQGYEAVKIMFYYLVNKILPDNDRFIVKNEINIKESL